MRNYLIFLLLIILITPLRVNALPDPGSKPQYPEPRYTITPDIVRPGEPLTIGYSGNFENVTEAAQELRAALYSSEGRRLARAPFFGLSREEEEPPLIAAVLAVPSTAGIGDAFIRIESGNNLVREIPFTIHPREFHSETIHLNQANTDLRTLPDPQKTAESELLWAIISRTGTEIYSGDQFVMPVSSNRRTSIYGNRRIYIYADGSRDTTIHAGIDIGVPTGTEVRACARGRVALARDRIVTGGTVILEHLPGVFSLYYHMDKITVTEGSIVEAGFPLGESGATGLVTGPHLHWEIRVSTENTCPDIFLSRPILDKKDIIDKITNNK